MKYLFMCLILIASNICHAQSDALVIVLDSSGSMGEYMRSSRKSRIQTAQDALVAVLENIPSTTKVGILTFDGWIYDLDKVDSSKVGKAIRSIVPRGGTPLYENLRVGATKLLLERQSQNNSGYYKLLVITDGEAIDDDLNNDGTFEDGSLRPGVLTDIISRNLIVDVIALDMGKDHDLMKLNNGLDMIGDDEKSLSASLEKSLTASLEKAAEIDTDGSVFSELDALPDDFVLGAIQGLTTFRNHPIGEKPLIPVAPDANQTHVYSAKEVASDKFFTTNNLLVPLTFGAAIFVIFLFFIRV